MLDNAMERENEMKFQQTLQMSEVQYNGRVSPKAKEEIYRAYLVGTTIKDLSLKYGILPQRVKAIVFQRHLYWNEVYPKLGETHMRMALERELLYATDFPFIDYGKDLRLMSEIEKGIKLVKVKGSDIDTNPPEAVKKQVEASLAKMKPKRHDFIPEDFVGKGGKAYILKNWVIHRGFGSPIVSKIFRDVVRLTGTKNEY
jgi:Eukaryotic mitochondrial regulator protein